MDDRPAGSPTAVDERMDRLELGMRDRGLREDRYVVAVDELHQVLDSGRNSLVDWRHELRLMRTLGRSPDPDLLVAPHSGVSGLTRLEQHPLHVTDRIGVGALGRLGGRAHSCDVGCHHIGVAASGLSELRDCSATTVPA